MKPFIAIDVETASRAEPGSICQISLVRFDGQVIEEVFSSLVNPLAEFDPFCVHIHGITEEDVMDAPSFSQIEDEIRPYLESYDVVAHNAAFDITTINKAAIRDNIDFFNIQYGCTLCAARTLLYGELSSYSLPDLCNYLGINLKNHHDSKSDAIACAELALTLCKKANADSIQELMERAGHVYKRAAREQTQQTSVIKKTLVSPEFSSDFCDSLFGKNVVVTGELTPIFRKDAERRIIDHGGIVQQGVNKETDVLIVGRYDLSKFNRENWSSKFIKAEAMKAKGHKILIINESEFLRLIGEK